MKADLGGSPFSIQLFSIHKQKKDAHYERLFLVQLSKR